MLASLLPVSSRSLKMVPLNKRAENRDKMCQKLIKSHRSCRLINVPHCNSFQRTFAMSSSVRPSFVTFVRPTQAIEIVGNVSTPFGTLDICDLSAKISEIVRGEPLRRRLNQRG